MSRKMKVLITGGLGFIGMYTSKKLVEKGHEVFVFDILSRPPQGQEDYFRDVAFIKGDLLNPLSLMEALVKNSIDRIIHMAALRNNDSKRNPYQAFKLNCEGTMNCFEAARIAGIKRVVFPGTVASLGTWEFHEKLGYNIDALPDDVACNPTNVYGTTKLFDELMCRQYNTLFDMNNICVRLPIIFGAGKKGGSRSSIYNDMIEKSVNGIPVHVKAVREEKFSLQYVKDSAEALLCGCLAEKNKKGVFNTGGTVGTLFDFAESIRKVLPQADITVEDDKNATIIDNTCIDNSLAKKEIGFQAQFTIEEGIDDFVQQLR